MVVPTDTALPPVLPATELVTNVLKHTSPGTTTGRVAVRFAPTEKGWLLQVADDGIGLPDVFQWTSRRSLGMRLVKTLAGRLGAVLEIERTASTIFSLRAAMPPV